MVQRASGVSSICRPPPSLLPTRGTEEFVRPRKPTSREELNNKRPKQLYYPARSRDCHAVLGSGSRSAQSQDRADRETARNIFISLYARLSAVALPPPSPLLLMCLCFAVDRNATEPGRCTCGEGRCVSYSRDMSTSSVYYYCGPCGKVIPRLWHGRVVMAVMSFYVFHNSNTFIRTRTWHAHAWGRDHTHAQLSMDMHAQPIACKHIRTCVYTRAQGVCRCIYVYPAIGTHLH